MKIVVQKNENEVNENKLFSIAEMLKEEMPTVIVDDSKIPIIKNGASLNNEQGIKDGNILIIDKNNNALAIYDVNHDKMKCVRGLWN